MGFFVRAQVIYVDTHKLFYRSTTKQLKEPKMLLLDTEYVLYHDNWSIRSFLNVRCSQYQFLLLNFVIVILLVEV